MQFLDNTKIRESLYFRHRCKEFDKTRKISDEDFDTILESARLSPSSFGFEPWKFLVIQNSALREKLKPVCSGGKEALKDASHFVVILARKAEDLAPNSEYITHIMRDVQKLPALIRPIKRKFYEGHCKDFGLDSERTHFDWACKQGYITLGNMMFAGALLGIDSVAMEGFEREKVEEILASEGVLDRAHFGVAVMVAFGYRTSNPKHAKTRQSLDEVVQFV